MQKPNKPNTRFEFAALLTFIVVLVMLFSNGFVNRIYAQSEQQDVYQSIQPIGDVLATILEEYVREPDLDKVVEGALIGMMSGLNDDHSSFISAEYLQQMQEDTRGEFEGIGVSIRQNEDGFIEIVTPILGSPAAESGLLPFDLIVKIDDQPAVGMTTEDAAKLIRGQRGTTVQLSIVRPDDDPQMKEPFEVTVKRDKVPLQSIEEAGLLDGNIGYIRIGDFKEKTARDVREKLDEWQQEGLQGLVLDLRWNPGGLLTSSKQVSELFLPKGSLVTYTQGKKGPNGRANSEDMRLVTERRPAIPLNLPMIILVNGQTASSSEIVTGALQYHQRAIVLGEKTFGKGSVQTIIPLTRPQNTALRLTTALYYTPADVTIDKQGILPDVDVAMDKEMVQKLGRQMSRSFEKDPMHIEVLDHGAITGFSEEESQTTDDEGNVVAQVQDVQLQRAVEILREDTVWDNLLMKYHRDVKETQMTASAAKKKKNIVEWQPGDEDVTVRSVEVENEEDAAVAE
jgi:carboxyl-terminal processing protease